MDPVLLLPLLTLLVARLVHVAVRNYRSHTKEITVGEAYLGADMPELPKPIDWNEFEVAVEQRLIAADDHWADIDKNTILWKLERDIAVAWPENLPWACPSCKHSFSRPVDPCPVCENKLDYDAAHAIVAEGGPEMVLSTHTSRHNWSAVIDYPVDQWRRGFAPKAFGGPNSHFMRQLAESVKTGRITINEARAHIEHIHEDLEDF